jgi:purine catabolism regulator
MTKRGGFITQIDGDQVLVVSATEAGSLDALRGASGRVAGATLVISEAVPDIEKLPAAYRRAHAFRRLAREGVVSGPVIDLGDPLQSGVYGVLHDLGATGPGESLARLVEAALRPLEQHDEDRRGELIHSLETYLDAGGSLTAASGMLGVHRNTLSYRLNRIEELLGQDLADPRIRFLLQFALAARRSRQAMGG